MNVFGFLKEINAEPVIPEGFPEWKQIMDSWGEKMLSAVKVTTLYVFLSSSILLI